MTCARGEASEVPLRSTGIPGKVHVLSSKLLHRTKNRMNSGHMG